MCGIAGIVSGQLSSGQIQERLERMRNALRHRGPDGEGIYVSPSAEGGLLCGLAHTRLAILDLSPAGHQPMQTRDGRYHITFNGEIYNFKELRRELEADGEQFTGGSDTEVILRMFARHGAECVREFNGMFAFAIWDAREHACFLARGPLGIKPLYYAQDNANGLVFASELQALLKSDLWHRRLNHSALQGYLLFGSVPEPETLIQDVSALPAGHYLMHTAEGKRKRCFWQPQFHADPCTPPQAVERTRTAVEESVARHFISDVPVGIFLSGGIDSTSLVALARAGGQQNLKTFSIAFDNPQYDEGTAARRTAAHFGTEHHEHRLNAASGTKLMQEFLVHQDQPSIDGFNTFCVSRHAQMSGIKVVLSGLGGDELFAGYRSFTDVPKLVRAGVWLGLAGPTKKWTGTLLEHFGRSPRQQRLGAYLCGPPSMAGAYWAMRGIFTPEEAAKLTEIYTGSQRPEQTNLHFQVPSQPTPEDCVSYLELTRYMQNQLLRDSDVMGMACGLELRVPFVDSRLVDSISHIPARFRLQPGKKLLLEAVPEIPDWVRQAPKRGFVFPFEEWMAADWKELFARYDKLSPFPLRSWYRRWALFALEHFLKANEVASPVNRQ